MASLSSVCFDPEKEVAGRWWENYRGHGFDLLIARWQNPEHRKVLAELAREARQGLGQGEEIDEDEWREINGRAMARTVWIGSRELEEDDTEEVRAATLNSPNFTQLREDIMAFALQDEEYLARAVGNSEAASAGS